MPSCCLKSLGWVKSRLFPLAAPKFLRSLLISLVLISSLFLSGCVRYDVGVDFAGLHRGTIIQKIRLSKQLTNFSETIAQNWLESIEKRARKLSGKTERINPQEIVVAIPFSTPQELVEKFNRFFNPTSDQRQKENLKVVQFSSQMDLTENNFIFLRRNHLRLNLDLRSIGLISSEAVVVDSGAVLNLEFSLSAPWGVRNLTADGDVLQPEVRTEGKRTIWKLQPGQINTIEAVFWLPEPLAFGTVAIALFVLTGFYLKYKHLPWTAPASEPFPEFAHKTSE